MALYSTDGWFGSTLGASDSCWKRTAASCVELVTDSSVKLPLHFSIPWGLVLYTHTNQHDDGHLPKRGRGNESECYVFTRLAQWCRHNPKRRDQWALHLSGTCTCRDQRNSSSHSRNSNRD